MRPSLSFSSMTLSFATAATLGLSLLMGGTTATSFAQDASAAAPAEPSQEQILAGLEVWKERGGCFNCHGVFAQGGEGGHFPAGPSLRKSQLDLETMHMVIACGLPGTKMPYNLKGAYSETECYGNELAPAPADVNPGAALSDQEITDLLAYISTRVQGQRRITKDQCVEYYGAADAPECATYR
jgi:mono/diheme cytochrome c family protein